jgi:hypothetical protein
MPKLANVLVATDLTTVMYGGDTYYRLADGESVQKGDLFYVTEHRGGMYVTTRCVYSVSEIGGRSACFVDDEYDTIACTPLGSTIRKGIFFRKSPAKPAPTAELLAAKRAESEALAAEITALEAKMRAEIVGSIAFVSDEGYHDDIPAGTLVKITEIDDDYEEYPYKAELLDGSDYDRFDRDSLEPVTYETARARLIAEVDRQLAAAFPDAKVAA